MPSLGGARVCQSVARAPSSIFAPAELLNDVTVHFERSLTSAVPPSGSGAPASDPATTVQPWTKSSGTLHQVVAAPLCVIRKYLPVAAVANGTVMSGWPAVG